MSFQEQFKGKRILITGAGRGFGRELVIRLHSYGAFVIALSRTKSTLESLEKECPGVQTICADLADWDATRKALESLEVVDGLVNNAAYLTVGNALGAKPEDFDKIFNINVKSVLNVCQVISANMIAAGKRGSIVNVSSVVGSRAAPYIGIYSASKAALQMLSQILAVELAPKGIRLNTFQPAGMATEMIETIKSGVDSMFHAEDVFIKASRARVPTGCVTIPLDQCVNSLLFLLSDLAPQIVGQSLVIDGGFLCT